MNSPVYFKRKNYKRNLKKKIEQHFEASCAESLHIDQLYITLPNYAKYVDILVYNLHACSIFWL